MNEAAAMRYLLTKGWSLIEGEWYALRGIYDNPVCIDTAFQLQRNIETFFV